MNQSTIHVLILALAGRTVIEFLTILSVGNGFNDGDSEFERQSLRNSVQKTYALAKRHRYSV
jgi:hypothetical protein